MKKMVLSSLLLVFTGMLWGQKNIVPKIQLSQTEFLVDEEIDLAITGLSPNLRFEIEATTFDQRRRPWIAKATFISDKKGKEKLSKIKPIEGTYSEADGMGLFWSGLYRGIPLDSTGSRGTFSRRANLEYETLISLKIDDQIVDSVRIVRRFLANGVKRERVEANGIIGELFLPSQANIEGAVLVLAGSDGGITSAEWRAALLASNGIPALALAYFEYENLPEDLIELPLEYVQRAVNFLKKDRNYNKVGIIGFSKGSELTLTYCSKVKNNQIDAIVAIAPSTYVWQGINNQLEVKSSWTLDGKPLDFIPWQYNEEVINMLRQQGPKKFRTLYEYSLASEKNKGAIEKGVLDLQEANAPVLLVAGTEDGSWPSDKMSQTLMKKLQDTNYSYPYKALIYEGAGHLIYWDFLPATDCERQGGQIFGGEVLATAKARRESWERIKKMLLKSLN